MAAGKTVVVGRNPKESRRPGPLEDLFQRELQQDGSGHRNGQPRCRAAPLQRQKRPYGNQELQHQDLSAKHGDCGHDLRHGSRCGLVNPHPHREIESFGMALQDLAGHPGKEHKRQGGGNQADKDGCGNQHLEFSFRFRIAGLQSRG